VIETLDVGQVKTVAVVILVGLVVLGLVIGFLVQKIVLKLGLLAVVAVLVAAVWWQRVAVLSCARSGSCTFFGVDVRSVGEHVAR